MLKSFLIFVQILSEMISQEEIRQTAEAMYEDTVALRRHMHTYPELSFQERETSRYIQSKLSDYGISYKSGYAENGVAAVIEGNGEGKTVVLRADFDALPIAEDASHDCCSKRSGVMHACGHDMHTASLLTVGRMMNGMRDRWSGRLMLVFQPGEECYPGGANVMMRDGLFDRVTPDVVIGCHVMPDMPTGHVGFCAGSYMASGDEIHMTVRGNGGHGAMPHLLTDNVLVACQIVVALQQLTARVVPATVPCVLSFGRIIADGATNVIPDTVYIGGTLRVMSEEWRAKMKQKIRQVAAGIAESFGTTCDIDIKDGFPSVYNDPEVTASAERYAKAYLGEDNVEKMSVRMTSEDFGYYTLKYPSVYYRFGVMKPDGTTGNVHTSRFDPDETSLRVAPAVMTWLALNFLEQKKR